MGDFNKKESESLDFTGLKIPRDHYYSKEGKMKTTSIKGVLSFCVAVTVTVAMAYSAVTVIQKNNSIKSHRSVRSSLLSDVVY